LHLITPTVAFATVVGSGPSWPCDDTQSHLIPSSKGRGIDFITGTEVAIVAGVIVTVVVFLIAGDWARRRRRIEESEREALKREAENNEGEPPLP
jgi:hypothetical protein